MTVLVLGMHRSGTSAVTRVVNLLGLPVCRPEDLLRGHAGNERGHWECAPLVVENEGLLEALHSRWWCPPDRLSDVAALADDPVRVAGARAAFLASHPTDTWVWKDPRTSLLMPFWRRVLPRNPVAIVVSRDPAEIAASMLARDNITRPFALALWERHLRLAVEGSAGLPLLVTDYADLVSDPWRWCEQTARFLRDHGLDASLPADPSGVRGFISDGLRHRVASAGAAAANGLTPSQQELWEWLRARIRQPGDTAPPLPPEGEAASALMREVRDAFALSSGETRPAGGSFVSTDGIRVLAPPRAVAPVRRPPLSVLYLPSGRAATSAQARRLRPRLPTDAEIITVSTPDDAAGGPGQADHGYDRPAQNARPHHRPAHSDETHDRHGRGPQTPDWFVPAHRDHPMTLTQRLNTAAEIARGQLLVVLAGPPVTLLPGWLPALRTVAERPDTAVVGPALHPAGGGAPVYGLAPAPLLLGTSWLVDAPHPGRPFPVPAASVAAMVTTRRAFEAVGGFDPSLTDGGGEDVDYCLRLWRAGWRCLAVPGSRVRLTFETLPATDLDVMVNTLRLGAVHLGHEQLAEQLQVLSSADTFAEALSIVSAGDTGQRRRIVAALSWYETAQLPSSLGVRLLEPTGGTT